MGEEHDPSETAVTASVAGAATEPKDREGRRQAEFGRSAGQRDQPAGATARPAATEERLDEVSGGAISLEFEISKSIRYHGKRVAFFEVLNHTTRALAAITAAGAIISIVGKSSAIATALNVVVALTLSFDLVFDFARRARIHDDLRREFCELITEMEEQPVRAEDQLRRFSAKRLKIQVREPSPIEVLNVVCANEELEARGYDYRYRVTPMQYCFRHFFSWRAREFPRVPAPVQ